MEWLHPMTNNYISRLYGECVEVAPSSKYCGMQWNRTSTYSHRWILTYFVRPKWNMGQASLSRYGLENLLDKTWARIGEKQFPFRQPPAAMMLARTHRANPDTLSSIVYRYAERTRVETKKSLWLVRGEPLVRDNLIVDYDWRKEENRHMQKTEIKYRALWQGK